MKCKVNIKTTLSDEESKVLYKLLGEISSEIKDNCSMSQRESSLLFKMYNDMSLALRQEEL